MADTSNLERQVFWSGCWEVASSPSSPSAQALRHCLSGLTLALPLRTALSQNFNICVPDIGVKIRVH
jgi:hypothetical protein